MKIGVMIDSYILPAWAYHSLERVINLKFLHLSLIIINDFAASPKQKSYFYNENNHNFAYRFFNNIDRIIFQKGPDAFTTNNAQKLFGNVPVMKVRLTNTRYPGCFEPSAIEKIQGYNLDILIRMGFQHLSGDILDVARFGVWSYYFGDPNSIESDLPGFWESVDRIPVTGSFLSILNHDSSIGKIIYRSMVQTYPFSPYRNQNRSSWAASSFLSRQIELLYMVGESRFFEEIEKYNQDRIQNSIKQYTTPNMLRVFWIFICLLFRDIHEIIQRAFYLYQWRLLINIDNSYSNSFSNFKELNPPRDRFWADPHIIQTEGKYYIFIEEYIYRERKGNLSVVEMEQDSNYKKPIQFLSKNYHLSYPFVFEWNGNYYLIPETAENRTIELYESVKFPFEWQFKMNLMENIFAFDSTLLYYDKKWWLFTGIAENEGALPEVELFLFYSKELFTKQWTSHLLNPIISDVRKARPAGKIFTENGKIYRPSQDCSITYGWGFDVNEITLLSENGYDEKTCDEVRPDWDRNILAVHTLSRADSFTVIDACRKVHRYFFSRWRSQFERIK